ncbi:protein sidekick-2-like [Sycon ciliatum]|uniref:protein sidekick-2-like n=1 Tax=Sycon ciliatum TaxID=27933 RepID=UPI0031F62280
MIYWMHNGLAVSDWTMGLSNVSTASRPSIYFSVLTISNVTFADRGTYTCVSDVNTTGYIVSSKLISTTSTSAEVSVLVPPRAIVLARTSKVVYPMTINVTCSFSGNPAPNITITAPGLTDLQVTAMSTSFIGELGDRLPLRTTTLIVSPSNIVNNGTYTCTANSMSGKLDHSLDVIVQWVPDAPGVLWVLLIGEKIVISLFAATPNNAPLTSYTVKYGNVDCLGQIMENSTDLPPSTNTIFIDVEPSQIYTVQLRASNAIGAGNYTLPTQILTHDKSPSGSPENVSVQALSPYSANVSWMPIPCMEQNGNISGYDVEYNITVDIDDKRYVDTYHGIQAVQSGSELSTIISGLNAFFTYNFRVRGRTVAGYGPYSPSISARTLTSVEPQYLNTSSGFVVTCNAHQEVILSCSFRAGLRPVITWAREDTSASMGGVMTKQIASSSNLTHTGTLTFVRVERTDEDNYTCTATNANGTDAVALYVRVQGR